MDAGSMTVKPPALNGHCLRKEAAVVPLPVYCTDQLFCAICLLLQGNGVAQLYKKLAQDISSGKVEVQQAQDDLEFAADAKARVGGIWASQVVGGAVKAVKLAIATQQLQMRKRA